MTWLLCRRFPGSFLLAGLRFFQRSQFGSDSAAQIAFPFPHQTQANGSPRLSLSDTPASADRRRRLLILRAPPAMVAVDPPPREEATAPALKRSSSIERIPEDARRILHRLAGELWGGDVDPSALTVSQLKGAMTNEVFRITWPGGEGDQRKVLVRIYGQGVEVFFDRADEVRTFECMSRHGQGPRLLGRFANGRIEEFINARTLSAADLRDPEISALIAKKLREFHYLDMPGSRNISLWQRLRRWLEEARGRCSEESKEFQLDKLGDEITVLESALSGIEQTVGFCHNDLQYGNIMIYEETRQVTLIDYEYASFNPVAFDIANHFCEMSADYHTATPHVLDFTKYPGIDEQRRFVQNYLSFAGEKAIDDEEVEKLLDLIAKYAPASHLFWGLWGIISAHVNKSIDFEYKEYARQRFARYGQTKPTILGSN